MPLISRSPSPYYDRFDYYGRKSRSSSLSSQSCWSRNQSYDNTCSSSSCSTPDLTFDDSADDYYQYERCYDDDEYIVTRGRSYSLDSDRSKSKVRSTSCHPVMMTYHDQRSSVHFNYNVDFPPL